MSEMTPVEASRATSDPASPALGETAAEAHRRVDLYDGLRGIAIVLVVLSHGWYVWPIDWIDGHAWVRPFFRSGNSGVTIFLVAGGFLMFRSLTARRPLFAMRADTTFVRRVARVGPSLWLFLVVAVVVAALDSSTEAWHADTGASVFHVATYTWNWYLQSHVLVSRPDFGHLWYLSVDMQAFLIMACLCFVLRRHRVGLLFALAGFYLLLVWWRFHVVPTESIFQVLLRTTVRMDPFVVGVLTAAALPYLVRLRLPSRAVGRPRALAAALVPLLYWCDRDCPTCGGAAPCWSGTSPSSSPPSPWAEPRGSVTALTGTRLATWLGRNSLLMYIWHFPVFGFVARHTTGRWMVVGGAHRGGPDDDGRDLPRGRPPPGAARQGVATATRLARPRRRRTSLAVAEVRLVVVRCVGPASLAHRTAAPPRPVRGRDRRHAGGSATGLAGARCQSVSALAERQRR